MSEEFKYFTPIRVRFYETDLQGHINFIWHPAYFTVAMAGYLSSLGFSLKQLNEKGLDLLFVDIHAGLKGPAFYDEELRVYCRIAKFGTTSVRFEFQTIAAYGERLVATGDLTGVFVEYGTRSKAGVPEALRQAVEGV